MRNTNVTDSSAGKISILILISDNLMRAVVSQSLERAGYEVLQASGLGPAVDWLNRCEVNLLVVRPDIGNMSGHDAAKYLRTLRPGIPVLMVGGLAHDDRLVNREALEGFHVFPKPFAMSDLLGAVEAALASSRRAAPR